MFNVVFVSGWLDMLEGLRHYGVECYLYSVENRRERLVLLRCRLAISCCFMPSGIECLYPSYNVSLTRRVCIISMICSLKCTLLAYL